MTALWVGAPQVIHRGFTMTRWETERPMKPPGLPGAWDERRANQTAS